MFRPLPNMEMPQGDRKPALFFDMDVEFMLKLSVRLIVPQSGKGRRKKLVFLGQVLLTFRSPRNQGSQIKETYRNFSIVSVLEPTPAASRASHYTFSASHVL